MPADALRRGRTATERIDGGVQAHRLLDHHARVAQRLDVGRRRRALAEHPVGLLANPSLDVGVVSEQVEGEGERERGRVLSRRQEDQDLVTDLGVVEGLAFGARADEQAEEVAASVPPARRWAMSSSQTAYSARWARAARRLPGVGQDRGGRTGRFARLSACSPRLGTARRKTDIAGSTLAPNTILPTTRSVRSDIAAWRSTVPSHAATAASVRRAGPPPRPFPRRSRRSVGG